MQPDGTTAVCKGLFKKETDMSVFTGLKVGQPTTRSHDWTFIAIQISDQIRYNP